MSKKGRARRSPSTADAPEVAAALAGIDQAMPAPGALTALKRDETRRAASEKSAAEAYLKKLRQLGVVPARIPSWAGLMSGEHDSTASRRSRARPTTPADPVMAMAGLADISAEAVPLPFATLRPPFRYEWTWTKQIYIAPGTLSAYAKKSTGALGFDLASSPNSNQVNKCRARAAIGIRFQPTERGLLGIRPRLDVDEYWYLKYYMRVAHAYAWRGLLVQSFDAGDNELMSTPIDQKGKVFDESGGGSILPAAEFTVTLPELGMPSLFVDPSRWYAIWIWCGGGIRAAGWQTWLGTNVGSDATSRLDVDVSSIALYFTPVTALIHAGTGSQPGR